MSQPRYVHYNPPNAHAPPPVNTTTIAPQDTTKQPPPQVQQPQQPQQTQQHQQPQSNNGANAGTSVPLIATGDWTKDLVHLAKTAELKKHALTLQLHTAHILSAHATLEQKNKAIQDVREQKNKLESERNRLINCLREINEDRDKADLMEVSLSKECTDLRQKISDLTDGEYTVAKQDVDRLRQELGQPLCPVYKARSMTSHHNLSLLATPPSIDVMLMVSLARSLCASRYLNDRRLNGNESISSANNSKRGPGDLLQMDAPPAKRPRGRPKGSRNKGKDPTATIAA
ncbi:hypothetical protein EYR38_003883 [Pleurotus pulmonarius]|nr:hypothetical protein EYR38_003883 [Pleurotus pulmonarius]